MKLAILLAPLLLVACATRVTHPERSTEQMRADVERCSDQANRRYWMDPVAALYNAYDCLDALGYQRNRTGFEAFVEEQLAGRRRPAPAGPAYCQVPCRPGIARPRR